jgi:hypothetical protein
MSDQTLVPGSLVCPECQVAGKHYEAKDNRLLGLHRRNSHGVPGTHHHARRKTRSTKAKAAPANPRSNGVQDQVVAWLRDHPGLHNHRQIAEALGVDPKTDRMIKTLSVAKMRGQPVASDGHGHWYYSGATLPVKAPEPEAPANNGQVHFVSQQIVLLLTDSEGREWVAEPR